MTTGRLERWMDKPTEGFSFKIWPQPWDHRPRIIELNELLLISDNTMRKLPVKCRLGEFKFDELGGKKKKKCLFSAWQKKVFSSKVWSGISTCFCATSHTFGRIQNKICSVRMHLCGHLKCKSSFNEESICAACGLDFGGTGLEELQTPSWQSLFHFFFFLHGVICARLYILPLNAKTISSLLPSREEPHLFFTLMISTVSANLSKSEGHL